jgi:hypothetical protein
MVDLVESSFKETDSDFFDLRNFDNSTARRAGRVHAVGMILDHQTLGGAEFESRHRGEVNFRFRLAVRDVFISDEQI